MQKTPEGFLVCFDVPIARTGIQLYAAGEVEGLKADAQGVVHVERTPEEVFREETIASANGKPVVNNHPTGDVTPGNWRELSMGSILYPRRGKGEQENLLLADLVIMDPEMIEEIFVNGKREVSCGYDAEYEQFEPGKAAQKNIVINHLAVVEKARCGAVCSIGDDNEGATSMAKTVFENFLCKLGLSKDDPKAKLALESLSGPARAVMTADEAGAELGGGTHLHVHTAPGASGGNDEFSKKLEEHEKAIGDMRKSHDEFVKKYADDNKTIMDALTEIKGKFPAEPSGDDNKEIEGALEEEAPVGTGDRARKAKDSALLQESYQETVALAEILVPGISVFVFDSAKPPVHTYKEICGLRKRALRFANADAATNALILSARAGRELTEAAIEKMPCGEARTLFLSVGALKKAANDSNKNVRSVTNNNGGAGNENKPKSLREANREFWDKRAGR